MKVTKSKVDEFMQVIEMIIHSEKPLPAHFVIHILNEFYSKISNEEIRIFISFYEANYKGEKEIYQWMIDNCTDLDDEDRKNANSKIEQ